MNKIDKKYCFKIAIKYNSRRDLRKNELGVYNTSIRNGWMDSVCFHMSMKTVSDIYHLARLLKDNGISLS